MANYYPLDSSVMNTDPFEEQNPIVGIVVDIENKLTGYEKIIGYKFTCKDCKFGDLFKKWMNYEEVNIEKCKRAYQNILKGYYDHFEMKLHRQVLTLTIKIVSFTDELKFVQNFLREKESCVR